jgi:hypothetical protein
LASNLKVGDKVIFADEDNSAWQGGKGVIKSVDGYGHFDVEILEVPPMNTSEYWKVGSVMTDSAKNLTLLESVSEAEPEAVEHPAHYGGGDNPYEVIKVAEAWGLDKDAYLFNVLKYIARAGKKDGAPIKQDLKKGLFYFQRRIGLLEDGQ